MEGRVNILVWFIILLIGLVLGTEVYVIYTSGIPEDLSGEQLIFQNQ